MKRCDNYQIVNEIYCLDALKNLETLIKSYNLILVNDVPTEMRNKILKTCFRFNKKVYITPKISDIIIRGCENLAVFDTPLLFSNDAVFTIPERIVKRCFDIFLSSVGLIVLSPIMILVSLAIFLYDRGPVFYRQTRYTKGGKTFKILKFRSMIPNAEKDGVARLASESLSGPAASMSCRSFLTY